MVCKDEATHVGEEHVRQGDTVGERGTAPQQAQLFPCVEPVGQRLGKGALGEKDGDDAPSELAGQSAGSPFHIASPSRIPSASQYRHVEMEH